MPDNNLDLTGQVDNILPDTQHISLWQNIIYMTAKHLFYKNTSKIVIYSATDKDRRH
jgi:hypothetical protein